MFKLISWRLWLYGIGAALALSGVAYLIGRHQGSEQCEAKHKADNNEKALAQVNADINAVRKQSDRAQVAGTTLAKDEQAIEARTKNLSKEGAKYVPIRSEDPGIVCKPDARSVRVWNAANSGIDLTPATATERDSALP